MLRLTQQRRAVDRGPGPGVGPAAGAREDEPAAADGTARLVELPCVFAPQMQPSREPGDSITLRFIQLRYRKMWSYARAQTCGAVAVRYQQGAYRRGSDVYAVWPASQTPASSGGAVLLGLNLGLFPCSVVTVHPFPLVRLLPPEGEAGRLGAGPPPDPAAIHARLRSLETVNRRGEAIAALGPEERLALLGWLASGGDGAALEVPGGT